VYRRIDANRFSAVIYKDEQDVTRGTVFTGGQLGAGIYYSQGDSSAVNSYNGALSVNSDDQALYLKTLGMSHYAGHDQKLSQEGAAEALWGIVITPLQRGR
jgi:hypothetical protein